MIVTSHDELPWTEWRPGVRIRVWSSAYEGASAAHTGEQLMDPGTSAPPHWHYYEEHLTFLEGSAEVHVDDEMQVVHAPATVVFPARSVHHFTNVGDGPLHLIGAVPWPIHETIYESEAEGDRFVIRGYEPGTDGTRRRFGPTAKPPP